MFFKKVLAISPHTDDIELACGASIARFVTEDVEVHYIALSDCHDTLIGTPFKDYELAEECRKSATRSQLLVTTHSPFFVNGLRPQELWVLYRDEKGYTQARRASDMRGISDFIAEGAKLGHLWMEEQFEVGDPLVNFGGERVKAKSHRR